MSGEQSTIKICTLSKTYMVPVWYPGETVLQWQERIAPYIGEESIISSDGHRTFAYKLIQIGKLINLPALRHNLMNELCDDSKTIHAVLWCFNPTDSAQMKGNLDNNGVETLECGICLEELAYEDLSYKNTIGVLNKCMHRFHWKCLLEIRDVNNKYLCPICREDITSQVNSIKYYHPNF